MDQRPLDRRTAAESGYATVGKWAVFLALLFVVLAVASIFERIVGDYWARAVYGIVLFCGVAWRIESWVFGRGR